MKDKRACNMLWILYFNVEIRIRNMLRTSVGCWYMSKHADMVCRLPVSRPPRRDLADREKPWSPLGQQG